MIKSVLTQLLMSGLLVCCVDMSGLLAKCKCTSLPGQMSQFQTLLEIQGL